MQRGRGGAQLREKVEACRSPETKRRQRKEEARPVRNVIVTIVTHEKITEHVDSDVRAYRGQQCRRDDGNEREAFGQKRSFTAAVWS
jgi:hypothetical protein